MKLLTCNPPTVNSGASSTCTVTLNQAAPAGGGIVALSSNSTVLSVPSTVTVPVGAISASFTAIANIVPITQTATITGTLNGSSQTAGLTLVAPMLVTGLACNPGTVSSGAASTCSVTLNEKLLPPAVPPSNCRTTTPR